MNLLTYLMLITVIIAFMYAYDCMFLGLLPPGHIPAVLTAQYQILNLHASHYIILTSKVVK